MEKFVKRQTTYLYFYKKTLDKNIRLSYQQIFLPIELFSLLNPYPMAEH